MSNLEIFAVVLLITSLMFITETHKIAHSDRNYEMKKILLAQHTHILTYTIRANLLLLLDLQCTPDKIPHN